VRGETGVGAWADRRRRAETPLNALLIHYRGEGLNPKERALIDGLFVDECEAVGLLTGISELSVSFRPGKPPAIRALSEVLQRRRLDRALAAAGLEWGTEVLRRVSAHNSSSYAGPLFRELYETVYLGDKAEPLPLFRFGIAAEFGGAAPVVKTYYDLEAKSEAMRHRSREKLAALLNESSGLQCLKRACPAIDMEKSRVVGVDFRPGNVFRAKFYWGARHLTFQDIAAAAREISGERHVETVERLRREVCSGAGALSSVLVSMCVCNGAPAMKLDVCIARLYENDGKASDAVGRFLGSSVDGLMPFELVSGGLSPSRTKCIQQYLGVELLPDEDPRVTLYYRPIGLETEHLNPALRPRMCA
jgi:hypothetical protein